MSSQDTLATVIQADQRPRLPGDGALLRLGQGGRQREGWRVFQILMALVQEEDDLIAFQSRQGELAGVADVAQTVFRLRDDAFANVRQDKIFFHPQKAFSLR